MSFERLLIRDFKGISELEFEKLARVNIFVGKNNTAKTSILEAIFLLVGGSNPQVLTQIHGFRELLLTDANDLRFAFRNLSYNAPIYLEAYASKNAYRSLAIKPTESEQTEISYAAPVSGQTNANSIGESKLFSSGVVSLSFELNVNNGDRDAGNPSVGRLTIQDGKVTIARPAGYVENTRCVFLNPRIFSALNLEKRLEEIIINKEQDKIVEFLRIVDERIQGISIGTGNMIYLDVGISKLIPANLAGDGTRRALAMLLSMYDAKNGVVLIDEIESGLHFSIVRKLLKSMVSFAKANNIQIFATTHNHEVLLELNALVAFEEVNADLNVAIYALQRSKEGVIKQYRYDYEMLSHALEHEIEVR